MAGIKAEQNQRLDNRVREVDECSRIRLVLDLAQLQQFAAALPSQVEMRSDGLGAVADIENTCPFFFPIGNNGVVGPVQGRCKILSSNRRPSACNIDKDENEPYWNR